MKFVGLPLLVGMVAFAAIGEERSRVPGGDPFVYFEGDTYYLYVSHRTSEGFVLYTSADLVNWKAMQGRDREGFVYVKGNGFGTKQFWAPEMYKVKDRYYLLHSANERVAVAMADSPRGPFRNAEKTPYFKDVGSIDNSLFIDDDGRAYLLYARLCWGNQVWICDLDATLTHAKPETQRKILEACEPWEFNPKSRDRVAEGPCLVKEKGLYYLTYSTHNVMDSAYNVCLATASKLDGPWTKQGRGPILAPREGVVCTGHHSLFKDKSGKWKIVFHVRDPGVKEFKRYVYTADASFCAKDGHPWIDIGKFSLCYLEDRAESR